MRSAALELVRPEGAPPAPVGQGRSATTDIRVRVIDGALSCIARHGTAKTTLDDVAREAGCSRATVYRVFPGGKDAVIAAVVDTEVARLLSELAVAMGEAASLQDALVAGMAVASERLAGHRALRFMLEYEPEVVLPHLTFTHQDDIYTATAQFVAPFLGRWLAHHEALRVAEWAARIVLSYFANPAPGMELSDPACARRVVRTYVLPGIKVLAARGPHSSLDISSRSMQGPRTSTTTIDNRHVPFEGPTVTGKGEAS